MPKELVTFRLYVVGHLANSRRAISNLTAFCEEHLADGYKIDVLDVLADPETALADNVLMTPMLVMTMIGRRQVIVGDLGDATALRHSVHQLGSGA